MDPDGLIIDKCCDQISGSAACFVRGAWWKTSQRPSKKQRDTEAPKDSSTAQGSSTHWPPAMKAPTHWSQDMSDMCLVMSWPSSFGYPGCPMILTQTSRFCSKTCTWHPSKGHWQRSCQKHQPSRLGQKRNRSAQEDSFPVPGSRTMHHIPPTDGKRTSAARKNSEVFGGGTKEANHRRFLHATMISEIWMHLLQMQTNPQKKNCCGNGFPNLNQARKICLRWQYDRILNLCKGTAWQTENPPASDTTSSAFAGAMARRSPALLTVDAKLAQSHFAMVQK